MSLQRVARRETWAYSSHWCCWAFVSFSGCSSRKIRWFSFRGEFSFSSNIRQQESVICEQLIISWGQEPKESDWIKAGSRADKSQPSSARIREDVKLERIPFACWTTSCMAPILSWNPFASLFSSYCRNLLFQTGGFSIKVIWRHDCSM